MAKISISSYDLEQVYNKAFDVIAKDLTPEKAAMLQDAKQLVIITGVNDEGYLTDAGVKDARKLKRKLENSIRKVEQIN